VSRNAGWAAAGVGRTSHQTGRPSHDHDRDHTSTIQRLEPDYLVDDAHPAAAAFLARYSGRTLEAYRHDLRGFFQWEADNAVPELVARRPHIELYRAWMDQRGLAAATIDRRLSTVCGFYRSRTPTEGSGRTRPCAVETASASTGAIWVMRRIGQELDATANTSHSPGTPLRT
jgi:Phage integrase, N-terminal SAM-like domain